MLCNDDLCITFQIENLGCYNRLVGKDHRSSPTATHKEDNQITPHVSNLLHNVYHTCMLWDLQTSTQLFLKSQLLNKHNFNITISISQNNHQVSNFSQYSMHLYESFYYTHLGCPSYQSKLPCCSKDSQNNISEAQEFIYFYKMNHRRALEDISEALEQKLSRSKDISEAL